MWLQLSKRTIQLGPAKVKLQTPSSFATLLCTMNDCSSNIGQYGILNYTQM